MVNGKCLQRELERWRRIGVGQIRVKGTSPDPINGFAAGVWAQSEPLLEELDPVPEELESVEDDFLLLASD